jgi:predicted aldo/keto reductase-like oxidoreductase
MNYRKDKYGNDLSILGYGCMRFPRKGGKIDMAVTEKLILQAIDAGVNYFDTAYIYPGSEAAVGEILAKNNLRGKVNIATKLPHYLIKTREGLDKLFNEELRRLKTDHVDYYLMHMLNDIEAWHGLQSLGIEEWIAEKKRTGAIRQVGFSYHGNTDMFLKVLDAYPWEFTQVQYNYLDEHSQAGRRGVEYAHSKGIPVIIMEPLRGGRLVNLLPDKAKKCFEEYCVKRSYAEWGLRWLWDQESITVVLSGMGAEDMLRENLAIASDVRIGELGEQEMALYAQVVKAINEGVKVGCTGCGYCQPCPKGVDIPGTFAAYNRHFNESKFGALMDYVKCTTLRKNATAASQCIGCGLCEKHCPQGIAIRQELINARKVLEVPVYKAASAVLRKFTKF